jgi:UDP-glucuronate decarboxylase
MKVLVTGHHGFIGSNIVKAINLAGQDVEILTMVEDIRHLHPYDKTLLPIDQIYHLASTPSPANYKKRPIDVIMGNVHGTYNVLELARKSHAKMLFTSTIDTDKYYPIDNSRAVYIDSKKVAEDLCYVYRKNSNVDVRIARLYSTYGPGMKPNDGRVIPEFIKAALHNEPLYIIGDGSQVDSFCYISDMTRALRRLMEMDSDLYTGPIEIGNPLMAGAYGLITIKELAKVIIAICKSYSEIVNIPVSIPVLNRIINAPRIPNIAEATEKLHWRPRTGLYEGLELTIKSFREMV